MPLIGKQAAEVGSHAHRDPSDPRAKTDADKQLFIDDVRSRGYEVEIIGGRSPAHDGLLKPRVHHCNCAESGSE